MPSRSAWISKNVDFVDANGKSVLPREGSTRDEDQYTVELTDGGYVVDLRIDRGPIPC